MLRSLAALAAFVLAAPLAAQETREFWSDEGDAYIGTLNADGATLVSRYPKTWFHGEPSEDHGVVEERASISFRNDCTAVHSELGAGTWGWWNDVFHADFGSHSIGFVDQELFDHGHFAACEDHF